MSALSEPEVGGPDAPTKQDPFKAFARELQRAIAAGEFATARAILDGAEPSWRKRTPARLSSNASNYAMEVGKAISREYFRIRKRPLNPVRDRGWIFDTRSGQLC
ncbi:hypothetical protein ACUN0C_14950 [Faunimonas sp. B44]|uniref:hypothetical protein n=1 Tax=Faunimonas sp. B44 TaxID=3461493 RepID=UPI004044F072